MTQLVTVSANMAALNIESLKTPRRISVKHQVEDTKADAERSARRVENAGDTTEPGLIPPTAVSIDILSSNGEPHEQATLREAEAAYREMDS